jgi:hypothetical protein
MPTAAHIVLGGKEGPSSVSMKKISEDSSGPIDKSNATGQKPLRRGLLELLSKK